MEKLGPEVLRYSSAARMPATVERVFYCADCIRPMQRDVDSCDECRRMEPEEIRDANLRRDRVFWEREYKAMPFTKRHIRMPNLNRIPNVFPDESRYQELKEKLYPNGDYQSRMSNQHNGEDAPPPRRLPR